MRSKADSATADLEQLVVEAMHLLTAPDQTYREASAIIDLTVATPRLQQARERWEHHWKEFVARHPRWAQ